jgi:thioredoxin-related protein
MKSSIANITKIDKTSNHRFRSATAYLLLILVSFSFIVEQIPFVEGDVLELVENAEKENDKKDKKLFLEVLNIIGLNTEEGSARYCAQMHKSIFNGVYLDITTPPPRFV